MIDCKRWRGLSCIEGDYVLEVVGGINVGRSSSHNWDAGPKILPDKLDLSCTHENISLYTNAE